MKIELARFVKRLLNEPSYALRTPMAVVGFLLFMLLIAKMLYAVLTLFS